ncbi:E3 ubiquitin ligase TRIM40-like [Dasypus novemcinctus]|uniref:E3 ubiquitin ligase TRIM40-like n=1 Tax=Dasypus novemcinctus TaxID=9361 RepID=UPI0039C9010B
MPHLPEQEAQEGAEGSGGGEAVGCTGSNPSTAAGPAGECAAEEPRVQAISKTVEQRSMLVADLERMAKDLDADMLKEASDVLTR